MAVKLAQARVPTLVVVRLSLPKVIGVGGHGSAGMV
jgi:hypothetical protein